MSQVRTIWRDDIRYIPIGSKVASASDGVLLGDSPSAGPYFTNQPVGYSLITDHPCSSLTYDSWLANGSYISIQTEGTEPYSPSYSVRFLYPEGLEAGSYPANHARYLSGYKYIYVGMFLKLSSTWTEQASNSPKLFFLLDDDPVGGGGGGDPLVIYRTPNDQIRAGVQNSDAPPNRTFTQNVADVRTYPGDWAHLEVIAVMNAAGENYDGEYHQWVNGTKVCEYTDVWYSDSATPTWDRLNIHPIWGGLGGTVEQDQYLYYDHIRICATN